MIFDCFTITLIVVNGNTMAITHTWTHVNAISYKCNRYTVRTNQSEAAVMQSNDNQPRQDDESNKVEPTNGLCISTFTKNF